MTAYIKKSLFFLEAHFLFSIVFYSMVISPKQYLHQQKIGLNCIFCRIFIFVAFILKYILSIIKYSYWMRNVFFFFQGQEWLQVGLPPECQEHVPPKPFLNTVVPPQPRTLLLKSSQPSQDCSSRRRVSKQPRHNFEREKNVSHSSQIFSCGGNHSLNWNKEWECNWYLCAEYYTYYCYEI